MAEQGALDAPRDVFHLTTEEIFAFFENRGPVAETGALARERRAQFAAYVSEPAPPARFETVGTEPSATPAAVPGVAQTGDLRGIGCCPGVVRAPVAIVRDPSRPVDLEGRILVAERTDPGWTLLFPLARGLLVERGSLLSHSAIVAREIGLPCIVGVPGLLDSLADGEMVEMDGSTGSIRRASV